MINIKIIGQPNVGKSTIFNKLTKEKQYVGNWSGKTSEIKKGIYQYQHQCYQVMDTPGIYSIHDQKFSTFDITYSDIILFVCDINQFERGLILLLELLNTYNNIILILNMSDVKKITIDISRLKALLKIPIISLNSHNKKNINILKEKLFSFKIVSKNKNSLVSREEIISNSQKVISEVVINSSAIKVSKFDKIISKKIYAIPMMLILLFLVFWLTIIGSNYPSTFLTNFFNYLEPYLINYLSFFPSKIVLIIVNGIYHISTWIIAVMLPPMLIFFPLFALLEESGFLPRISFNLDKYFRKCQGCGNQALTMCMGFGCNAVGVSSCRIINNKKQQLLAIITNSFVPCNGRFPGIIAIISIFMTSTTNNLIKTFSCSLCLLLIIFFSILMTFIVDKILSKIILKEEKNIFFLELPQYHWPKFFKVITGAIIDRVFFVLSKSLLIAAPAGLVIYLLTNNDFLSTNLLNPLINFLNPYAGIIGLDGVIIIAFILGFPANEIVIPIMLMLYLNQGTVQGYDSLASLKEILQSNGWNVKTALCFLIFSLMHFPCATTCLTIKKETKSNMILLLSIFLPLVIGIIICLIINLFYIVIS